MPVAKQQDEERLAPLTIDEIRALEHDFIGPTWRRDENGAWILPEATLGWQIARWCSTYMMNLDDSSKPWKFTLEQLRFILWWYAVDPCSGRFIYRTGVLQRMKGWGKDPLLAVISLVELVGPSRVKYEHGSPVFKDGHPVGIPHPNALVQVTAVNQAQTGNTVDMIPLLVSDKMRAEFGIKDGQEIVRANNGRAKLVAVTSSYRALEGKRTTFTLLNETHHWVEGNKGHKMFETIDGNATKMSSRYLAITNAYLPGEESVAEKTRLAWEAIRDGRKPDTRMMYDSVEANPLTPLTREALNVVIPIIRGDAVWLDVEEIVSSVLQSQINQARSQRMYLNQVTAAADALVGPENWKPLARPDALLKAGDPITLGFDGGKTDDSTVLVAIRTTDKVAFVLHIQEKDPDDPNAEFWQVNRTKVDSAVHEAFRLYDVKAFYADVALWESNIDNWAEQYGEGLATLASARHAIAWDMRQSLERVTRAHERLLQAIYDQAIFHDDDPDLRRHAYNARRRENRHGLSFGKETPESPLKVDAYAALMLAHEALHDLRTRKRKPEKNRTGEVWGF